MPSAPKSVKSRKAERELFFWTARQTLMLIALTALTAHLIASLLAQGEPAAVRALVDLISRLGA